MFSDRAKHKQAAKNQIAAIEARIKKNDPCHAEVQAVVTDRDLLAAISGSKKLKTQLADLYTRSVAMMANSLIKLDKEAFEKIDAYELYRDSQKDVTPTIFESIELFNKTSAFVVESILNAAKDETNTQKKSDKIIMAIEYWIAVADQCLRHPAQPDMNMLTAIVAALNSTEIHRLYNRDLLSENTKKKLEEFDLILSTENNSKNQREFSTEHPHAIPYIGLIKTDFTFLREGNPNIDPQQFHLSYKQLQQFRATQKTVKDVKFDFAPSATFREKIHAQKLDDKKRYDESIKIQARGTAIAESKITKKIKFISAAEISPSPTLQQAPAAASPSTTDLETIYIINESQKAIIPLIRKFESKKQSAAGLTPQGKFNHDNRLQIDVVQIKEEAKQAFDTEEKKIRENPLILYFYERYERFPSGKELEDLEKAERKKSDAHWEKIAKKAKDDLDKRIEAVKDKIIIHLFLDKLHTLLTDANGEAKLKIKKENLVLLDEYAKDLFTNSRHHFNHRTDMLDEPPLRKAIAALYYIQQYPDKFNTGANDPEIKNNINLAIAFFSELNPRDLHAIYTAITHKENLPSLIKDYLEAAYKQLPASITTPDAPAPQPAAAPAAANPVTEFYQASHKFHQNMRKMAEAFDIESDPPFGNKALLEKIFKTKEQKAALAAFIEPYKKLLDNIFDPMPDNEQAMLDRIKSVMQGGQFKTIASSIAEISASFEAFQQFVNDSLEGINPEKLDQKLITSYNTFCDIARNSLIMPAQQLMRYPMLLEAAKSYLEKNKKDTRAVDAAHTITKSLVDSVNNSKEFSTIAYRIARELTVKDKNKHASLINEINALINKRRDESQKLQLPQSDDPAIQGAFIQERNKIDRDYLNQLKEKLIASGFDATTSFTKELIAKIKQIDYKLMIKNPVIAQMAADIHLKSQTRKLANILTVDKRDGFTINTRAHLERLNSVIDASIPTSDAEMKLLLLNLGFNEKEVDKKMPAIQKENAALRRTAGKNMYDYLNQLIKSQRILVKDGKAFDSSYAAQFVNSEIKKQLKKALTGIPGIDEEKLDDTINSYIRTLVSNSDDQPAPASTIEELCQLKNFPFKDLLSNKDDITRVEDSLKDKANILYHNLLPDIAALIDGRFDAAQSYELVNQFLTAPSLALTANVSNPLYHKTFYEVILGNLPRPTGSNQTAIFDNIINSRSEHKDKYIAQLIQNPALPIQFLKNNIIDKTGAISSTHLDSLINSLRDRISKIIQSSIQDAKSLEIFSDYQAQERSIELNQKLSAFIELLKSDRTTAYRIISTINDNDYSMRDLLTKESSALRAHFPLLSRIREFNTRAQKEKFGNAPLSESTSTTKIDLRDVLPNKLSDYIKVGDKSGGINSPGKFGGVYVAPYRLKKRDDEKGEFKAQTLLIKQDTHTSRLTQKSVIRHEKNIAEFITGRMMNAVIGDNAASIFYIRAGDGNPNQPDPSGENIYIGSIFYDDYEDLFKVLGFETRPYDIGNWNKTKFRAGFVHQDAEGRDVCNFAGFDGVTIASLMTGDFDVHTGNYGVVFPKTITHDEIKANIHDIQNNNLTTFLNASDENRSIVINIIENKPASLSRKNIEDLSAAIGYTMQHGTDPDDPQCIKEIKYALTRAGVIKPKLVKIDHGAGLKMLEDDVHIHSITRHPFGLGPTNHIREFPRDLKVHPSFADELRRQAAVDLTATINDSIDETARFYGIKPLADFAANAGINAESILGITKRQLDKITGSAHDTQENKEKLVSYLKNFLVVKMEARQRSLIELANEIEMSLCIKEDKKSTNGFRFTTFTKTTPDGKQNVGIHDIIKENPLYFLKGQFHFRGKDQRSQLGPIKTKIFKHSRLAKMVNEAVKDNVNDLILLAKDKNDPSILEHILLNDYLKPHLAQHSGNLKKIITGVHAAILSELSNDFDNHSKMIFAQARQAQDPAGAQQIVHHALLDLSNKITKDILAERSQPHREQIIIRYIGLMDKAMQQDEPDYFTCLAIYQALNNPSILSLQKDFASLPEQALKKKAALDDLFEVNGKFDPIVAQNFLELQSDSLRNIAPGKPASAPAAQPAAANSAAPDVHSYGERTAIASSAIKQHTRSGLGLFGSKNAAPDKNLTEEQQQAIFHKLDIMIPPDERVIKTDTILKQHAATRNSDPVTNDLTLMIALLDNMQKMLVRYEKENVIRPEAPKPGPGVVY